MENLLKIVFFVLGIVFQFAVLGYGKIERSYFRLVWRLTLGFAVVLFLLNLFSSGFAININNAGLYLLTVVPVVSLLFVIFLYDKLVFVLDEATILLWDMIFFYLLYELFGSEFYFPIIFWPLCVITGFLLFLNLSKVRISKFFEVILSLWFYFILVVFAFMRFPYLIYMMNLKGKDYLVNSNQLFDLPLYQVFILGSLLVLVYLGFATFIEFFPGRNTTIKKLKMHVQLLSKKYVNHNSTLFMTSFLVLGVGGSLIWNYFYKFFDPFNFASLVVFVSYHVLYFYKISSKKLRV